VQLINAKRDQEARLNSLSAVMTEVVPYTLRQQEILASLASQAAVALNNSKLYVKQQELFEGFVTASVRAIEARDPTTSGHSFRVAAGTVELATVVDRATSGPYKDLNFTRDQMKEIRYASLLHDFGKVGVREHVLLKAKKLYPLQLTVNLHAERPELEKWKFQYVKRTLQLECEKQLNQILEKDRDQYQARRAELVPVLEQQLKEIDEYFATVRQSNVPTVMPEGNFEKLMEIAARHFLDFDGVEEQLLTPDEVRLLSIRKGTFDDDERRQIEEHVIHTFNFLSMIPWTKEIRNIPEIARGHHEKLTGKGYPYKLAAPEIPLQTRMMTICDIFDALQAKDRPYKKKVSTEEALNILNMEVKDQNIDANLFQVFVKAKVFDTWKDE
jgi:HD-GYP domain-containing protein (c-di-GMP phosphodiesterase class II)